MRRIASILALTALACGGREDFWETYPTAVSAIGLPSGVAVLDPTADRALVFRPHADGSLLRTTLPIGHGIIATAQSRDQSRVGLLAVGSSDSPRRDEEEKRPQLTVLEAPVGATPTARVYPLASRHSGLAMDPRGEFAIVHATPNNAQAAQIAENPNELVFIDLRSGASVTRSLRSFGGRPQRFTFTPPLGLPGGARRLLLIETEQDLAIVDLEHLDRPEITVRLTSGQDARAVRPAGVAYDEGLLERDDDTRIAIRLQNTSDIVTLTLAPDAAAPTGFTPQLNLADAGGVVTDLAFVQTDAGLRIAALVPSAAKAILVEPDTSRTIDIDLGASFSRLSLSGGDEDATQALAAGELALLYGAGASVGFWTFRVAADRPYRTVELLPLPSAVNQVLSVPGASNLRVAIGSGNLFVLNLAERSAAPISTQAESYVYLAPDGGRLWVYRDAGDQLAQVQTNGALTQVALQRRMRSVFDVATEGGGRSLLAFDDANAASLTVLDALAPDPAKQVHAAGLLLMDAP